MRGKDGVNDSAQAVTGITPAYAGKSSSRPLSPMRARDHPRVCGEKPDSFRMAIFDKGSPPRMRGKGAPPLYIQFVGGITPAYAGKSCTFQRPRWRSRDHPRVCGEKQLVAVSPNTNLGSPPRMRGKEEYACKDGSQIGITPAYAGKSAVPLVLFGFDRDHPRVCGEKTL